jgi:hypothetical protein
LSQFSFNQMTVFATPLALPSDCAIRSSCSPCSPRTSGKESPGATGVRVTTLSSGFPGA